MQSAVNIINDLYSAVEVSHHWEREIIHSCGLKVLDKMIGLTRETNSMRITGDKYRSFRAFDSSISVINK